MSSTEPTVNPSGGLDLESLKALAHPLRVKIIDVLSTYGAHTASGLADKLGESSGATSYHLRQLEKHSFVREVEGKGTARERWWERVPVPISIDNRDVRESPSGKAASKLVFNEWVDSRERRVREFVDRGDEVLSPEWMDAATLSLASVWLTSAQLKVVSDQLQKVIDDAADSFRGQRVVGARPVQLQIATFPVLDGVEITSEDPS
jgi:DNA-binding transcriptional ArsR family regulator